MTTGKKIIVWLERWGLWGLIGVTLILLALAVAERAADGSGWWSALIDTVRSDADKAQGWTGWMHLAFKGVLAWAGARVYMAAAGLTWDTFSARWLARRHVVIAGGGAGADDPARQGAASPEVDKADLAVELAISLADRGEPVVLCLRGLDPERRTRLWSAGVIVLDKDLGVLQLRQAASLSRARMLVAMRDDYRENIALVRTAVSPVTGNADLVCKCMIEPLSVRRRLKVQEYFEPDTMTRIRVFNESEMLARSLLRHYPPDRPVALSDTGRVHVLLVGLGSVGQALLIDLAKTGHGRSGLAPKVTLVDRQVRRRWRDVVDQYPALPEWLMVEEVESTIEDVSADQVDTWLRDEHPVTMVYVCTRDEVANLRIARLLLERLEAVRSAGGAALAEVVVVDPPGGCVLSEFASTATHHERLHVFSLARGSGKDGKDGEEGFLYDLDDRRAQRMHEAYLRFGRVHRAHDPKWINGESNRPWECLPEPLRDSNRQLADLMDFRFKLRAVGCELSPADQAQEVVLDRAQLLLLARIEHDRWWAERELGGWRYAPETDRTRRLHENLIDFAQLSPEVRALDENAVTDLIAMLKEEGLVVTRQTREPLRPTAAP